MFWRLGWLLARRTLGRNALAVISLAVSTLMLCFSLTIDTGSPGTLATTTRQFVGGDVIVQMPALALPGVALGAGQTWAWQPPALAQPSLLGLLAPQSLWYGTPAATVSAAQVAHAAALLAHFPGVAAAVPYRSLPALWPYAPGRYALVQVLARSLPDDVATGFAARDVTAGHYFAPDQADAAVALVDGFRPDLTGAAAARDGYARDNGRLLSLSLGRPTAWAAAPPAPGAALPLLLPAWRGGAPDYSSLVPARLQVVGQYQVQDGSWNWRSDELTGAGVQVIPASPQTGAVLRTNQFIEPADWSTGAVLVPAGYWQSLAKRVGWRAPAAAGTWVLRLAHGLSQVNRVVTDLQRALPYASVVSVGRVAAATQAGRDPAVAVPARDRAASAHHATPTAPPDPAPQWVATAATAAGYAVALLLFAGNLYVVLINRRREIATLRALGAGHGQIASMLAAELGAVAATGMAVGLVLAVPVLTWQVLSNGGGVASVAMAWLRVLAVAGAGALPLVAAALGLGVAWAARLPVLGVLRGG